MKDYLHSLSTGILITALVLGENLLFFTGCFSTLTIILIEYFQNKSKLLLIKDMLGNIFAAFASSAIFSASVEHVALSAIAAFYTFLATLFLEILGNDLYKKP